MLYDEIKMKRVMCEPIGFQELAKEGKERKELIIDSYKYSNIDSEDNNDIYYFNLFYSNITYTCNYLIRVLPYSFIAIELQGDGFDDPDRLFFSINSTFYNTLNQRADLRELIPEMFYFPPLFYNNNDLQLHQTSSKHEIDNVIIKDWDEKELRKYQFLKDMKEFLENEEKLNEWIDLIFGVNKEYRDLKQKKQRYYNKNNNINFKGNPQNLEDNIIMQSYDFGVLPYQLFAQKFPKKINLSKIDKTNIFNYNKKQFKEDHKECLLDGKNCFTCKGEKGINKEYLKKINQIKEEFKPHYNLYYLFEGDVFGNLSVYIKEKNKDKKKIISEFINNKILSDKNNNNEFTLFKVLTDHTNEIKYIDYNPRLNLLVDYALDGFIHLYTMPTLKLVNSIQTKDFNINDILNYVVLISNPFPMICCVDSDNIFVFDINGKLINKLAIEKGININFCIDKNCGLLKDYISYIKNDKEYLIDLFKEDNSNNFILNKI
jgi:hypothetical protein